MLYTTLAGADFGAGFWQLFAGRGEQAVRIREHAHRSMGPVWEANHVWLIFVLTVFWTSYPRAFGSIASTLAVPLFIAALGIVFRGAAYALRDGASSARESATIDVIFSVSSILTPFALGAAVGAIATDRVPVGNAGGQPFSSWLNPTSIFIGVLAVANSTYLAAVYLAADADRRGDHALQRAFRRRALAAGVIAGAIALAGIVVVNHDYAPALPLTAHWPAARGRDRLGPGRGDHPGACGRAPVQRRTVQWRAGGRRDRRRLGACPLADDPSWTHRGYGRGRS